MDYRYLLFFEHDARVAVLEHLADMAAPSARGTTTLVLPDRTIQLPFADEVRELRPDDPDPWSFLAVLRFPPDQPLEDYARRERGTSAGRSDDHRDAEGRVEIGYVYLAVRDEPTTTDHEDLVRFSFGTPGSTMSVLFLESDSVRETMVEVLEECRGVYGLFDMEDRADLIWLRGERRDDRLPTADLTLAEIEEIVSQVPEAPAPPLPLSFAAEQVVAAARHLRRTNGGTLLGVHHWLLALHDEDGGPQTVSWRQALTEGDPGAPLSEGEVRERAVRHARRAGRSMVTVADLTEAVGESRPPT